MLSWYTVTPLQAYARVIMGRWSYSARSSGFSAIHLFTPYLSVTPSTPSKVPPVYTEAQTTFQIRNLLS
jgi:hypothetical protein